MKWRYEIENQCSFSWSGHILMGWILNSPDPQYHPSATPSPGACLIPKRKAEGLSTYTWSILFLIDSSSFSSLRTYNLIKKKLLQRWNDVVFVSIAKLTMLILKCALWTFKQQLVLNMRVRCVISFVLLWTFAFGIRVHLVDQFWFKKIDKHCL